MTAETMQAVELTGHGGFEKLQYRSAVPVPVPAADEVLVRVRAAGVNNTDVNMREGWYSKTDDGASVAADGGWTGEAVSFPLIQGADACGEIVAVGNGVASGRIGERVLVDPVLRGRPVGSGRRTLYLGSDCNGAFAEYVAVPAVNAHRITSPLSDAELASFPCSYTAAENMLTRAAVSRSDTVFVTGASGGVGSAAVQLAVLRGAHVIASAGAQKIPQVLGLGAAQGLLRNESPLQSLGRDAVDVVIDVVGGAHFPELLQIIRPGGRYAVAGAIAGPIVSLDLRTLYLKDLSLLGCTIAPPEVFLRLLSCIEAGNLRPVVALTYPLASIVEAQREFLAKRHTGKIVLIP